MIRFHNSKRPLNKKLLIFISDFIRRLCGGDRIGRLSKMMITQSKKIYLQNKKKITILDFGCGSMEISKKLEELSYVKQITGVDTFASRFKTKKMKYMQYNNFFKNNKKKYDLIIIIDVLHHMGIDGSYKILKKLSKFSKNIVIKDHFEHGFFSRQLLRFVDFYANYAYDVNIPKKYYDYSSWKKTIKKSRLKEVKIIESFQQHDGLFNLILNKKHHFVSHLKHVKK